MLFYHIGQFAVALRDKPAEQAAGIDNFAWMADGFNHLFIPFSDGSN
jgi:hypothetical protein